MIERSESRDGYAVRVLAVHTTEGSGTAEALRDATWWTGSSHALADDSGKLLTPTEGCVPYDLAAWTLRSGNRWSENIELVGFAKWKRGDWLARPKLLDACARWLAVRSRARGIPLVKLTPKEYAAGRSGVIGHVDHTVGYNDGTHWDPGPEFPYDVVLGLAADYATSKAKPTPTEEPDLDADQNNRLTEAWQNSAAAKDNAAAAARIAQEAVNWVVDPDHGILKQLGTLSGQIAGLTVANGGADADDIKAAAEAAAAATVRELGARLSS